MVQPSMSQHCMTKSTCLASWCFKMLMDTSVSLRGSTHALMVLVSMPTTLQGMICVSF